LQKNNYLKLSFKMENNYIKILDKKIHYQLLNQEFYSETKPVLVFLHEGLGSILQWKDFPEIISQKFKLPVLLYDRYGHGKSQKLDEERNSNFLHKEATDFLPELLKQLNINNKLILIGHSDGGTLALIFASLFPDKICFLITEAHHIVVEEMSKAGIFKAIKLYKSGWLRERLEKYHGENTESMFYGWANTWTGVDINNWNIVNILPQITCPVLAIQGVNDEYGTLEQLNILKQKCKTEVEIHYLDNCGHVPHFQLKDQVIEIIINFYNKFI